MMEIGRQCIDWSEKKEIKPSLAIDFNESGVLEMLQS